MPFQCGEPARCNLCNRSKFLLEKCAGSADTDTPAGSQCASVQLEKRVQLVNEFNFCLLNTSTVLWCLPVLMTALQVVCAVMLSQVDGDGCFSSANAPVRLHADTAFSDATSSPVGLDLVS